MSDQNGAPWQQASVADFLGVDFESPIEGSLAADAHSIGDIYVAHMNQLNVPSGSTPESRVFSMLAGIMGMYFKPDEPNEPFGPMMTFGNNRTAIPSDFQETVDWLSAFAPKIRNIPPKARICDLCWYIDRKKPELALIAIDAYCDIIEEVEKQNLAFHIEREATLLSHDIRLISIRALQISRAAARDKPQRDRIYGLVSRIRELSFLSSDHVTCLWFSEITLDFRISDPKDIGDAIKHRLNDTRQPIDAHISVDLWRVAARAYQYAKLEQEKNDCLQRAAERLAQHAHEHVGTALLASHFLSDAIAQLQGIPNVKELRASWRHELVDIQERVLEEMSQFSQKLELEEIVRVMESSMKSTSLLEKLFIIADIIRSPDPIKVRNDAEEIVREHPLSALFSSSHLDRHGKTIKRGSGGLASEDAIADKIAQGEMLRRKLQAAGQLEPAIRLLRVRLRMPQCKMRRHRRLPMATWIMAVETSMRCS